MTVDGFGGAGAYFQARLACGATNSFECWFSRVTWEGSISAVIVSAWYGRIEIALGWTLKKNGRVVNRSQSGSCVGLETRNGTFCGPLPGADASGTCSVRGSAA